MDLKNNHALHGALAGVLVYAITKKPLPALAIGGGAYLYMATYGHALPGTNTTGEPLTDDPVSIIPTVQTSSLGYGWNTASVGWAASMSGVILRTSAPQLVPTRRELSEPTFCLINQKL